MRIKKPEILDFYREVLVSNLGWDTYYPDRCVS
jgi:hypothetical protein